MLTPFGENLWLADGPVVESYGFRYPTRMAVIRLDEGGLFVWSPVALTEELRAAVDALGVVRFLVTPTAMHHVALPGWRAAYPDAKLVAAPGSRERASHIAFDDDLTDAPSPAWAREIDQVLVRGNRIATEAVFFHRASRTVLIADLLQQFPPGWFSGWRALVAKLDRMTGAEPQTPMKFRMAFADRKAARADLRRILDWPVEKVVIAHGAPVTADGKAFLARAFGWLGA